ncbi:unnamed protein product [Didymodactylos carnosus]|uniref:Uncharacterized protein n=1 Tax=Didymodactylos carnosus TaxID=1234261 RepID=A0A815WXS7_9BILA|nr:unnamed protein product [Didymodactylos carnosus]CAF1546573.1 unnamed protein product [Didymodactylos carnosus]CAF4228120.1 unnamed protein product [Didymodactylos carnosus]CAF4407385.1 unnamed protein product [Didymodactylos carnosus]
MVMQQLWTSIPCMTEVYEFNILPLNSDDEDVASHLLTKLMDELCKHINSRLSATPLLQRSPELYKLLEDSYSDPRTKKSVQVFYEFISHTNVKPLFYSLLHPGITEIQLKQLMHPTVTLAKQLPSAESVVFFGEVNTSSCLVRLKKC